MFFFRYYLDRQAIYYIRSHYEGASDYEKLLAYGKENNIEFDYTTGSNYHNRFNPKDGFKRPYNMKVQVPQGNSAKGKDLNNARMVEFIVNLDTGEFDSQWDAYDKHKLANGRYDSNPNNYFKDELREIANTESLITALQKVRIRMFREFIKENMECSMWMAPLSQLLELRQKTISFRR